MISVVLDHLPVPGSRTSNPDDGLPPARHLQGHRGSKFAWDEGDLMIFYAFLIYKFNPKYCAQGEADFFLICLPRNARIPGVRTRGVC